MQIVLSTASSTLEGCDDAHYFVDHFPKNALTTAIPPNLCVIVYNFFHHGTFDLLLIDDYKMEKNSNIKSI